MERRTEGRRTEAKDLGVGNQKEEKGREGEDMEGQEWKMEGWERKDDAKDWEKRRRKRWKSERSEGK